MVTSHKEYHGVSGIWSQAAQVVPYNLIAATAAYLPGYAVQAVPVPLVTHPAGFLLG
jgi:hypothetical protein